MKKFLFLIIFLPIITFAQDDWEYVATTKSEDNYYIKDIIKDNYGLLSFWVKIQKSEKKEYFKGQKYYRPSDLILTKWTMDCQNKTTKTQTIVVYDLKGKVRHSSNGPFEESYIIPDSVAEKVMDAACNKVD